MALKDAEVGEWIAMSKYLFSKPSEILRTLPGELRSLIETSKGKGYRFKWLEL